MSQASADIARYLACAPRGVTYDKSAKRYVAGDDFRPVLAKPDGARLLSELRLVDLGILKAEDAMLGVAPPFDATPVPQRPINPFVLRVIFRAIRERRAVDVVYQSISRPQPVRRIIEPMPSPMTDFAGTPARSTAKAANSATSCSDACRSRRRLTRPAPPRRTMQIGRISLRSSSRRIPG